GRGAHGSRAGGAEADRPRALERRDRQGALRERDDGEDARRARAHEARVARSRTGGRPRVRVRHPPARRRLTAGGHLPRHPRGRPPVDPEYDVRGDPESPSEASANRSSGRRLRPGGAVPWRRMKRKLVISLFVAALILLALGGWAVDATRKLPSPRSRL